MVIITRGDIFKSKMQTLVNPVNCVGVMGKGLALQFRKRFPEMYQDYRRRCRLRQVKPGKPYLYRSEFLPLILNFPTKRHWREPSRLEDIVSGLKFLEKNYTKWGITSLAVPPLGCGNGGLDWRKVGPIICECLGGLDILVEVYTPR